MSKLPTFQPGDRPEDQVPPLHFSPRPFQKEVFDKIVKTPGETLLQLPRQRFIGVDIGEKDGDKTVVVRGVPNRKGGFTVIAIDEYGSFPDWKWYRNPFKWWWWHRLTKKWKKSSKYFEFRSTPPGKNRFKDLVKNHGTAKKP